MKSRHGCVLLLAGGILLSVFSLCEGAPLLYPHKSVGSTADPLSTTLYLSLVVSLTALVALVVLFVNCVSCCKEREINFKEFEDHFEDEIDFTPPAEDTPSMQSPAEVYTLAVSPVALPGPPHLQPPARITEGPAGFQVARHSLSYIQEIGNGWFGQVLLSEIYTDPGGARVVVKELKANASAKEQNDFLQQGDPYRVLQHPNILQCLGQCVEAIPFLLVFEYCEMGDLRGYLSQQDWVFRNAELLQLQRMACEIAAGVTHLHKHNFLHSDLALRNCYLTADLTVKVGDYGIGPYRYKEDYIITEDDVFAPLRWLAPELVGERHGGVVTMEPTKPSNVWALGVTLWELFENAAQPYPHLSDREVLNHVIKDQQVKLFKPQLELPYSDRWYEVLQFCWLSPDKRATAEEVHRLLTYLRMQGQKDMEEDFEQRWDALKPNPSTRQTTVSHSSFPILEQFADDALRQEIDEVLTVTETSKGLSFEYVWEAAKHDHYEGNHRRSSMDTMLNYHSMFFPVSSEDIQAHFPDSVARAEHTEAGNTTSGIHGIVPVFDVQKPTNGNEYYIQLEEQGESTVGGEGSRGQDLDFSSGRQDFVVLQDVRLDESSTDADFFHQSIDSKDSYLPDSHIWSSLENDSPYHTNIFTEGGSKQGDSPSWGQSFMELPERNGNPFHEAASLEVQVVDIDKSYVDAFLGGSSEATHPAYSVEVEGERNTDVSRLLNSEKLADNFLFLKENNLMKEGSGFSSPQENFLLPGIAHEPEDSFRMRSWDNLDSLCSLTIPDNYLKPASSSTSSREELLDSPSASLDESYPSLIGNQTLVPSITVVAEDNTSIQLPVRNSSSTDDFGLLQSSDRGLDSGFDSTSERFEVTVSQTDHHTPALSQSATMDSLCTDAKIPSLEEDIGTSKDDLQPAETEMSETLQVQELSTDNGHNEDLTSNDLLSELTEDADIELETTLSDHEESFMDTNGRPLGRSSLLVSGPSLDQISQDSLLEDSMSTTLPTIENSAETPDSLDSLDIHRLAEQGEDLNAQIAQHKLQPPYKISDSGYETENLESPEWNSQPNVKEQSPVKNGLSVAKEEEETEEPASATNLVPPEIVISEVEGVPDAHIEDPSEDQEAEHEAPAEEPLMGSNYRDSAYFSDNESEPEKKSEEMIAGGSVEAAWLRNSNNPVSGGPALEVNTKKDEDSLIPQQESSESAEALSSGQTPDQHVGGVTTQADLDITEKPENNAAESVNNHIEDGNQPDLLKDITSPEEQDPTEESSSPLPSAAPSNAVHAKLTRTYASDGHKIKEPDMEGRYLGRRDGSALDGQEDGGDADEEDENSEDSDDDMRAYQLHSSSSDSEDDTVHPVPVIVSDDSRAKNLKSLLKPTTLNIEASSPQFPARFSADNSRRAVSFFDDVTVYLFDQETPTKELGDHSSGSNSQAPELSSPVSSSSYMNRFTNSESSTDEEGGGFEWDDDFSSPSPAFLPKTDKSPASKTMSTSAASRFTSPPSTVLEPSWTGSSNYSRFSISPASIASFSLTHLTDSDIEQGGNSEDGEKD
ncbi:serine/threonine-protein kinase LMTK2 isoform X2 [Labrus mixtus]|uniref:serine/threonine-protein kinase LMTK2 isoform X2 n=1 Tax=Labrus mixtus TaxID=508554 RepID=UPI0029C05DEF|nr:serine/threonine-protein kinase LMTK2 isoform X2 [Labrus mixtus]